jgi:hypothetical protein
MPPRYSEFLPRRDVDAQRRQSDIDRQINSIRFPGEGARGQAQADNSVPLNNDLTMQTNRLLERLVDGQQRSTQVMSYVG